MSAAVGRCCLCFTPHTRPHEGKPGEGVQGVIAVKIGNGGVRYVCAECSRACAAAWARACGSIMQGNVPA